MTTKPEADPPAIAAILYDQLAKTCDELRAEVAAKKDYAERMDALAEARYTENQTLRAENKQLRGEVSAVHDNYAAVIAEIERLTLADRQWADHVKRLSEENERLQVAMATHLRDAVAVERKAWQAKVERLKAALTEITDLELEGDASLDDAMRVADETLHPPA